MASTKKIESEWFQFIGVSSSRQVNGGTREASTPQ